MKTIWKYPIVPDSTPNDLMIPEGGRVLTIQVQNGVGYIWVLVDPDAPVEVRSFCVFSTGQRVEVLWANEYVGTFQIHNRGRGLVSHLFEQTQRPA